MSIFELAMMALQLCCCVGALGKGLPWRALYWFAAFILTLAVVKGLNS